MANEALRRVLHYTRSKASVIAVARSFWILEVVWWELGKFYWTVAWCHWPKQSRIRNEAALHILLVADPQVLRPYKSWLAGPSWIKQYLVNHNLRKSWSAAKSLRPQMVVFLGDMLRQGSKATSVAEYGEYYNKFNSIFKLNPRIPVYYVPGNRDVGLGSSARFSSDMRSRYESYFGPTNQLIPAGDHSLILLDAPALVEEDYRRHGAGFKFTDWSSVSGGSIDFVKSVASSHQDLPVILFTHIPLWRPETASCGPLREYGSIRRGVGKGYQSLLGKETSKFLLENVRPTVIFSADDHDYCEYVHPMTHESSSDTTHGLPEITVKSFSMATKLKRPGFQLLSLFPMQNGTLPSPSYAQTQCLLPDQAGIYTRGYIPLFLLTIIIFFFLNLRRGKPPPLNGSASWQNHPRFHTLDSASPGRKSPPISPIQYKSSRSRTSGLRSASTLTPMPSQPATPLGGTPFLSPSFPAPVEEDESQELLIWQSQLNGPKLSPFPRDQEVDSSYFLPSIGDASEFEVKKTTWKPAFGSRAKWKSLCWSSLLSGLALRSTWSTGPRRARTWVGRCLQDLVQVFLLPALLYILISLYLYF